MTVDIFDRFMFEGKERNIVAISAPFRFQPIEYGITPVGWPGYHGVYSFTDTGIYLEDLFIDAKDGYYPEIEGVLPICENDDPKRSDYKGHRIYKGLNIRLPYSGRILIGDELISEYYVDT